MNVVEFVKNVVIPPVFAAEEGNSWQPSGVTGDANALIRRTLDLILIIVVVAAVIFIMFAGIQYVTSQGDASKAKTAMSSITNAIIGLVVAFAAYALIQLVMGQIVGKEIGTIPSGVVESTS
jgi:TRAP-type C4-dicarboxylate transport system permease small subunit